MSWTRVRGYSARWQSLLLFTDTVAFFASFYFAMGLVSRAWDWRNFAALVSGSAWLSIALWVLIFARLGMYRSSTALSPRDEIYCTVAALGTGIMPELLIFTIVPSLSTSRLLVFVAAAAAILLVGGSRVMLRSVTTVAENSRRRRVLHVGFGEPSDSPANWAISRYCGSQSAIVQNSPQDTLERLAWFRSAQREDCDTIVIAGLPRPDAVAHLVALADRYGIRVAFAPPELQRNGIDFDAFREGQQTYLAPVTLNVRSTAADFCKSIFDRGCALAALLLLSPLLVATAIAIRVESPGGAFFKQDRVGRGGRVFRMWKFRSMRPDARTDWATANDDRITRVGAVIRRFSIDELPQLFNVVRGEMSLVGPRPEMVEYAERFSRVMPRYNERHLVRPGITGWTQINLRRHLTPDDAHEVLENDLFYIQHWSFLLDLSILLKTASEFLFHRGV
ncbi:MAG TPA: exopolysaccharide biosynthesis polyprenyl glycosylphosphotransferase [Candidatus Acidoferrales bacterium]|nr:exopolysaccharide biosynthesis polyprenyl glycosylphosphotransferase [Candidatus Acidoferrales bacterium]